MGTQKIFTHEFSNAIDARIPDSILEAMKNNGWNALGICEVFEEVKREFKKQNKQIVLGTRRA